MIQEFNYPKLPPAPLRFAVEINNLGDRLDYTRQDLLAYTDSVIKLFLEEQEKRHLEELRAYELTASNLRARVAVLESAVEEAVTWLTIGTV